LREEFGLVDFHAIALIQTGIFVLLFLLLWVDTLYGNRSFRIRGCILHICSVVFMRFPHRASSHLRELKVGFGKGRGHVKVLSYLCYLCFPHRLARTVISPLATFNKDYRRAQAGRLDQIDRGLIIECTIWQSCNIGMDYRGTNGILAAHEKKRVWKRRMNVWVFTRSQGHLPGASALFCVSFFVFVSVSV
jgi:hypothetical protein